MRRTPTLPDEADDFVCPGIPDYVDGSFLTVSPAGDQAADLVVSERTPDSGCH